MPDPVALAGTGATLEDIFNAVAANNNNVPGGIMTQPTREATVAIHAYIDHASDIAAIPLSPFIGAAVPGQIAEDRRRCAG